jgi:hypothetical protein
MAGTPLHLESPQELLQLVKKYRCFVFDLDGALLPGIRQLRAAGLSQHASKGAMHTGAISFPGNMVLAKEPYLLACLVTLQGLSGKVLSLFRECMLRWTG